MECTGPEAIAYTLDAAGNRAQMADSAGTTTWAYDALDRLTSAQYPNGDQVSYTLDPVGNRTGLTANGATTTSTYDAADELTQAGGTAYTYDQNGNELTATTGGATTTYSYDPLNRLTGIAGPTAAAYTYNGDGLRVAKSVGGATTAYTWDPTGIGHVLADGSEYLWGAGLIGQVSAAGAATYAHADGLGSVRLLTDASGNVAGREQYDTYGAPRSQSGNQLPFTYTGEQVDPESELVYLRARYLDPATGRFLSRYTFPSVPSDPGSLDRYAYTKDAPTGRVDPTGHSDATPDPGQVLTTPPAPVGPTAAITVPIISGPSALITTPAPPCPWASVTTPTPDGPSSSVTTIDPSLNTPAQGSTAARLTDGEVIAQVERELDEMDRDGLPRPTDIDKVIDLAMNGKTMGQQKGAVRELRAGLFFGLRNTDKWGQWVDPEVPSVKPGSVDIVLKNGDMVEVGGVGKFSDDDHKQQFYRQMNRDMLYAAKQGGAAKPNLYFVYVPDPGDPPQPPPDVLAIMGRRGFNLEVLP